MVGILMPLGVAKCTRKAQIGSPKNVIAFTKKKKKK
jgi:hypothetical protein